MEKKVARTLALKIIAKSKWWMSKLKVRDSMACTQLFEIYLFDREKKWIRKMLEQIQRVFARDRR